jgi:hypothetical protein
MGEGDQRNSKRTEKLDSRELKRLSALSARDAAVGSDASAAELPSLGRTATLDDPLTTSLLAEVARRSQTIEVSNDQIAEALELAAGDREPGDPATGATSDASGDRSGDPT